MLQSLFPKNLGPTPELNFELGERLTTVTGNNGLGTTSQRRVAGRSAVLERKDLE